VKACEMILVAAFAIGSVHSSLADDITAIVANRTIYPGQMVGTDQVASVELDHCEGCVPGYVVDQAAIVGKVAGRTILPNQLIYPDALRSAPMIRKGSDVTLIYRSGGLTISVAATSLKDAAIGDTVAVRTRLNNGMINGVIQPDGSVLAVAQ
jgi:flagellar basal body P-ring formation protein FlgA